MSLFDGLLSNQLLSKRAFLRTIRAGAAIGAVTVLASCTVKPLYSDAPDGTNVSDVLSSVAVDDVSNRLSQQVRNQLTFRLHRGGAQPSVPEYRVRLVVTSATKALATVDRLGSSGGRPSARRLSVTATYTLIEVEGNKTIATGKRVAAASYDLTSQRFTSERASLDAQNRAAREVANSVYLAVASKLSR